VLSIFDWSLVLFIAYLVWAVVVGIGLVLERRSPIATLGWLLTLLALPYVGALVWLFFGPRRLERRRLHYADARRRIDSASLDFRKAVLSPEIGEDIRMRYRQLLRLAERLHQPPPARAQDIALYFAGDECYAALEQAIGAAQHHVHLEYYIWEPGKAADRILACLVERARAGVAVKVLLDDVGSGRASDEYFAALTRAGGMVAWFNPLRFSNFRPTLLNFRTHRKIVVCDGRVGFTGGMNISSAQSVLSSGDSGWRDTHMRITGAPVAALQRVFLEDWYFAAGSCEVVSEFFPESAPSTDGALVQVIASGPDTTDYAIQRFLFAAIASARDEVRLTTAYFVPDDATLEALKAAALRGVDVQILVPRRGDSRLVTAAARSYFDELARTGVKIYEYGPPMLHAKTLEVDRSLAIVGTANTDNRSFRLNFEVIAGVIDPRTAQILGEQFDRDRALARRYQRRERGAFWPRVGAASARLFSPLL
jgi:cardiolipin synthase